MNPRSKYKHAGKPEVLCISLWQIHNFFLSQQPQVGQGLLIHEEALARHTTVGRTPLDKRSDCRRDLYLATYNTQARHPCPRWDSNPQSQQASGRRPLDRLICTLLTVKSQWTVVWANPVLCWQQSATHHLYMYCTDIFQVIRTSFVWTCRIVQCLSLSLSHTLTKSHTLTHTHTHTHTHTLSHTHTHTHSNTHTHTHTYKLTHTYTHSHTHTHTNSHILTHVHTHKVTHCHAHSNTYTHTHVHSHTHTHTHTNSLSLTHTHKLSHTHTHNWHPPRCKRTKFYTI